jgi:hypothetical protein
MKKFIVFVTRVALVTSLLLLVGVAPSVEAQSPLQEGINAARGDGVPGALLGDSGFITTITNTLLFIVGALAVIMIIFGGIRYATSAGNASSVTAAKNTVLYAVVGLIIAFLAFAAVNWILGALIPGSGAGFTNV